MIMPLPGNVRGVGQIGEYIEIMLEAMYLHKKIRFQYTEINNAMKFMIRYGLCVICRKRENTAEKQKNLLLRL